MVDTATALKPETKHVISSSLFDMLLEDDPVNKVESNVEDDILELLFKLYELIDYTKKGKIEKIDAVESFVLSYDSLLAFISKLDINNKYQKEISQFVKANEKKLLKMINGKYTVEQVCNMLTNILKETEDLKNKIQGVSKKKTNDEKTNGASDIDTKNFNFDFLDLLYRDLYEAINNDNSKKITVARGRLIKELKRNQDNINNSYNKVSCLIEISGLLDGSSKDLYEVAAVLRRSENRKYLEYFGSSFADYSSFVQKFNKLYEELKVNKIILYKKALNEELKEHKKVLKERYSSEFLDKRAGITSVVTMLPNAVGLAVKDLSNSINQLKNAKANRDKVNKSLEVLKSTGKLVGTPIVYAGKFVLNNWYAFYALTKGFLNNKIEKDDVNDKGNDSLVDKGSEDDLINPGDKVQDGTLGGVTPETPIEGGNTGEITDVENNVPGVKPNKPILNPEVGNSEFKPVIMGPTEGVEDITPELPPIQKPIPGKPGFQQATLWDDEVYVRPEGEITVVPETPPVEVPVTNPEPELEPETTPNSNPVVSPTVTDPPVAGDDSSWKDYFLYPYWFSFDVSSPLAPYEPVAGSGATDWNNMVTEHNLEVIENYKELFEKLFGWIK